MAATAPRSESATLDTKRDALAALLRRSPAAASTRTEAPASSTSTTATSVGVEGGGGGGAGAATPKPMPFDVSVPPPTIERFELRKDEDEDNVVLPPPPRKRIVTPAQLQHFLTSRTHDDLLSFLRQGAASIVGVPIPDDVKAPEAKHVEAGQRPTTPNGIEGALAMLSTVAGILDAHPPLRQNAGGSAGSGSASAQGRFGNPTFRDFYNDVVAQSDDLHAHFFPALRDDPSTDTPEQKRFKAVARRELKAYFDEAWGNARRIDYGSGMELNFVCWLLILYKLGIFDDSVQAPSSSASASTSTSKTLAPLSELGPTLFLRVFWSYILLMRRIQATYFLEPAGSHGVWGLDDYHFLPFLLGAAQLSNHQYLRPSSIHSTDVLSPPSKYPQQFMYLSQIALLHSIKTIPTAAGAPSPNLLRWHSPMLDDISSVKSWAQVERGMWKMFEAEVVGKLPVAQHFLFGQVLAFPVIEGDEEERDEGNSLCGHGHHHHGASSDGSNSAARVVLDAEGKPLPKPTGHAHVHSHTIPDAGVGIASNTVDAPQQGGTTGWGDCCGIPIPSAYGAAALAAAASADSSSDEHAKVKNGFGAVVAETGQLGRAKGYSASPAALAAAAAAASGQPETAREKAGKATVLSSTNHGGSGGVRRIPFD